MYNLAVMFSSIPYFMGFELPKIRLASSIKLFPEVAFVRMLENTTKTFIWYGNHTSTVS